MVGHGTREEPNGYGKISTMGYIDEKLVYGSKYSNLPAECAEM